MSQSGIMQNLEKGLASEQKALDLCGELLNLVDNDEDREDVQEIMADEARHIKITQELMDIVANQYIGEDQ